MRKFPLFFLVFCLAVAALASDQGSPQGAWLQDGTKWTNAPADINPHLQSAPVALLYFGKDHRFALLYCTVVRVPRQYMTISNGDPRAVYQGEWKARQRSISVAYQLVEATILLKGQELPGPMQYATIQVSSGALITLDGKTFRRAASLDKSASEALHGTKPSSLPVPSPECVGTTGGAAPFSPLKGCGFSLSSAWLDPPAGTRTLVLRNGTSAFQ